MFFFTRFFHRTGTHFAGKRFAGPNRLARARLPELTQKPSFPVKEPEGTAMDQSLKSPGQSALEDAFHAMFELSRSTPAPTLGQRLGALGRSGGVVAGLQDPRA